MTQSQIQDGIGLDLAESKPLHQLRFWLILFTNNPNHLINIEIGDQVAFKDVQTIHNLIKTMRQSTRHCEPPPVQPLTQNRTKRFHLRTAVNSDHIEVDAISFLKVRGCEQVSHHLFCIHSIGARSQHQSNRIFMIRFITQIDNHREFFCLHLCRNLFQNPRR